MENDIPLKINDHDHEIKSLKHRMDCVEAKQNDIYNLTLSVHDLAKSVEGLAKSQAEQGHRLEALEKEPAENAKFYRRTIISCIITAVVGALVGAAIALIL